MGTLSLTVHLKLIALSCFSNNRSSDQHISRPDTPRHKQQGITVSQAWYGNERVFLEEGAEGVMVP